MSHKPTSNSNASLILKLNGLPKDEDSPKLAIHAVAKNGEILESVSAISGEKVKFSPETLKQARTFAILSADEKPDTQNMKAAYKLSSAQIERVATTNRVLELSPSRWRPFIPFFRCVDGDVRKCWWWPFFVDAYTTRVAALPSVAPSISLNPLSPIGRISRALQPDFLRILPPFRRCKPICEGVVEIYERVCCCRIIIRPPLIVDICDRLKNIIERVPLPEIPELRPPRPRPDPVPFEKAGVFEGGTIGLSVKEAQSDLHFLQTASLEAAEKYVLARPYLIRFICSCGAPVFKGSTLIGPDGNFSRCFPSAPFLLSHCHREYAFKVRQIIDGQNVVIYDGLAANIWFDEGDDITLTSYNPKAVDCNHDDLPIPVDTPFAMLQDVGSTEAWNLKTPAQDGNKKVDTPSGFDGLCFPAANVAAARGKRLNCNWGGSLHLRYLFTEKLKDVGAKYFRVSVCEANSSGASVGTPAYIDHTSVWKYYENLGGFPPNIKIKARTLNLESDPTFYEIPYNSDQNWLSGRYHTKIDTNDFADGRHLVTLELYDVNRNRIVPNNATAEAGDVATNFAYEWWHDPAQPSHPENTQNVPYTTLSHLFWWDNRKTVALIDNFYKDNVEMPTKECHFMSGIPTSTFSAKFRAYHPHPWFLLDYHLWWKRGLSGASKTLERGTENAGGPSPASAVQSNSETYDEMLNYGLPVGEHNDKCTFALSLYVNTKTWNGSSYVDSDDSNFIASFALDMS